MNWQLIKTRITHLAEMLGEKQDLQLLSNQAKLPWLGWDGWVSFQFNGSRVDKH